MMTNPHNASFGALLKMLRTRRHLTQQAVADALGIHRRTLGRWEQGDYLPESRAMVLELARLLKLDDHQTRQLLEASLTALAPHWSVPFARNQYFTGREDILEALHTHLSTDHVVALTQSYALHGLGGVGKTQIALEYAYRYALEHSAVFWIEAETEETAISSLVYIADVVQVSERQEADQQRAVAAVQRWLRTHERWLLIWDNLEDLDLLPRLLPATIRQGALLLTTRCQAFGKRARGMDVPPMEQEEGVLFVLRRAKVLSPGATVEHVQHPDAYTAARELVRTLGGLPLALDQAGAYIEETGCGLVDYLHCYEQQRLHLLNRRGMERETHPLSVVATLGLACQRVAQQNPAALELLRFCACLYPDAIPEELLLAGADVSHFGEMLATLRTFSLIQRQPETHTLSLHRLVQVILFGGMREQERAIVQSRVVHLLNSVFPEITITTIRVETWELRERLLPHVLTCLSLLPEYLQNQEVAMVLLKAAAYLSERSQWAQAERLCHRAVSLFEHILGPEHPQLGSSLFVLAALYHVQGKYEQAESLYQRALLIQEPALGETHPEVALLLCRMGQIYYLQRRYERAEAFCQRALRLQEQVLGQTHPDLTVSLIALGTLYYNQGQNAQAELMYQRVLQINEQTLGPDHPDLARALNNLGAVYIAQGKYAQAEPFCQRAVLLAEQGWGAEHHNVANMLDTLATLYCEMGQDAQAKPLYQRVLQIAERMQGPEPPFVAFSLHGLALVSQRLGEDDEAESYYQRALHLREQQVGQNHPETAQTLHDLALFRKSRGNRHEARSLALRALQIREKALGDTHPHTVASRTLVAQCEAEQESVQDGGPFPWEGEERPDHMSTALQEFLDACCELHPLAWCRVSELWRAYEQWATTAQRGLLLPRRIFAAQLKARGCWTDRTNTARIWRGIRLVQANP